MIRKLWARLFATTAALPVNGARPIVTEADLRGDRRQLRISSAARVSAHTYGGQAVEAFTVPAPAPGVVNRAAKLDGLPLLAMDDQPGLDTSYANAAYASFFKEGLGFLGYPYLSELSQRAEYRRPVEILAKEMTRKWIKFTVAGGDSSKGDRVNQLETAFRKFRVRELFKKAAEGDGYFGRAQLFVDTGDNMDPGELLRPLIVDRRKLEPGFLRGFRYVEPIWSYPSAFNATDPLDEDFYKPPHWFVQAKSVHTSRMLTFVSRPMPDILKPAYVFGGLSLTQMGKPYVDNWLETRQGVNDLIQAFSQPVLKTDMAAVLEGGGADDLMARVDLMTRTRSNRSTAVIDKDTEDYAIVSAPIAGLDKLQAQAQEHMAAVFGIPLVVLLGVTPSGLNASSDGEIKTFYAWVKAMQEQLFGPQMRTVLALVQLHLWGEVDPSIDFEFEPLWEDDATTVATVEKTRADTHTAYVNMGAIAPEEVRETLANDAASPYQGVDLTGPPPEPPADPSQERDPMDDDEDDGGEEDMQASDSWYDQDHPRDKKGRFGVGGTAEEHRAGAAFHHETSMKLRKEANEHRAAGRHKEQGDASEAANGHAAFAQHHMVAAKRG